MPSRSSFVLWLLASGFSSFHRSEKINSGLINFANRHCNAIDSWLEELYTSFTHSSIISFFGSPSCRVNLWFLMFWFPVLIPPSCRVKLWLFLISCFDSPLLQGQVMVIQLLYKAISCHPWKQRKRRRRKDGFIYFLNTIDSLLHHLK